MASVIPLRDRKKLTTRRAIADAALALALEHGPNVVTVDDIAAAADVSPRTVFNYFATKDQAILGDDPDRRAELCEMVATRPRQELPLAALAATFADVVAHDARIASAFRIKARLVRENPQLQAAYVASQQALEDGMTAVIARRTGVDADRDPYPRLVATVAITTFRSVLARTSNRNPAAIATAIETAFAALTNGLVPPRPHTGRDR